MRHFIFSLQLHSNSVMSADREPAIPCLMEAYLAKGVGCDMALKTTVYVLRLLWLHSSNGSLKRVQLEGIISDMMDCRMLYNTWKYIGTFWSSYRTCVVPTSQPLWLVCTAALSFFFRGFEQLSGDLAYLQRHWKYGWNRLRLSWHFKFWKSLALICCAIVETRRIIDLRAELVTAETPAESPALMHAGTPVSALPVETTKDATKKKLLHSSIFLARNVCDLIIYLQWIPNYKPDLQLQFICGLLSGASGMWLVWDDLQSGAALSG